MLRLKKWLLLAGSLLTVGCVAAGITYAAVPGAADHQVRFCYKASDAARLGGAQISVIDPSAGGSCKSGQTTGSVLDQALVTGMSSGAPSGGFTANGHSPFSSTITTTQTTKLLALGRIRLELECQDTTKPCYRTVAMTLDGEVLDQTVRYGSSEEQPYESSAFQVVEVPAGTHTLTWSWTDVGSENIRLGVIDGSGALVALGG